MAGVVPLSQQNGDVGRDYSESDDKTTTQTDDSEPVVCPVAPKEKQANGNAHGRSCGPNQVLPSDALWTCKPDGAVKLRLKPEGPAAEAPISVPGLLSRSATKYPDKIALTYQEDGQWKDITYSEYEAKVRTVAKAFLKLGLKRYHGVCILGFNSPEWFISDLAAIHAGGFAAGIYTTNSAEACYHCLESSRSNICVVEDEKQLQKILSLKHKLPELTSIVQFSGTPNSPDVLSWKQVLEIGEAESDDELNKVLKDIAINECCTLVYTSGTEGPSKAVMIHHDNLTWLAYSISTYLDLEKVSDSVGQLNVVSYLPLSHVAAQITDIYSAITVGARTYFADKNALKGSLVDTLKIARPHVFLGVPRVWEKIAEKLQSIGKQNSSLKQWIASWAKSAALSYHLNLIDGVSSYSLSYKTFQLLIYGKIKQALGLDRCKFFLSAAAPISPETKKYFMSLDIPLSEAFGMSECSGPHTASKFGDYKLLGVGRTLPGCETKIHEPDVDQNGEFCLNGRHVFMGYLNEEDKTKAALDSEGYLHSGDVAKVDEHGFIYITGRIKELLITAGGENVAPVPIEHKVQEALPVISNAFLIGDKRKFLSLLVTLKTEVDSESGEPFDELTHDVKAWCNSLGVEVSKVSEIIQQKPEAIYKAIQAGIDKVNKQSVSNAQKIQKFEILPIDFSQFHGELGPTMKVKRPIVLKKYAELIENFYAE